MTSDEKNRKVSYTEDEKVSLDDIHHTTFVSLMYIYNLKKIIMEYCLKTGTKLYEKLSSEVSRKTQSLAWQSIADELTQIEQINVESATKLKQNVTNWIRRATVSIIRCFFFQLISVSTQCKLLFAESK